MTAARSLEFSRRKTNRVVGGGAGGLADTLGVPDAYVRAAFLTLLAVWGLGGVLYLGFWLMAYDKVEDREVVEVDNGRGLGLGLAFLGLLLLLGTLGWWPNPALVLTAGALAFGTAALTDSSKPGPLAALMDPNVDRPSRTRLILGVVLLFGGLSIFIASIGPVSELGVVFLAIMVTGLGIVVAFGPWVRRLIVDLGTERNERIRQEERAEMAAHLHDSVLQTLALIQRTDDPARMAILARHQETELRDWLFGAAPLDGVDLVSTALRNAAARVEKDHQVPIDVVTVGDHLLDKESAPLIGAASEAMVNAAKHSGADRLSLYLEAEDEKLTVYVTDQGKGFDLDKVAPDRKGIAESIKSRVENAGGTVEINSEPGDGTEVVMRMPVESG
ncbi:MAG: ATP-binding protein [Acidimicrobiia bacterium]